MHFVGKLWPSHYSWYRSEIHFNKPVWHFKGLRESSRLQVCLSKLEQTEWRKEAVLMLLCRSAYKRSLFRITFRFYNNHIATAFVPNLALESNGTTWRHISTVIFEAVKSYATLTSSFSWKYTREAKLFEAMWDNSWSQLLSRQTCKHTEKSI